MPMSERTHPIVVAPWRHSPTPPTQTWFFRQFGQDFVFYESCPRLHEVVEDVTQLDCIFVGNTDVEGEGDADEDLVVLR